MNKYARMVLDRRMYDERDGRHEQEYRYTDSRRERPRDYGHYYDYDRYDRNDRNRYPYRDYGYPEMRFSRDDMDEWRHKMQNEDGTVGEHFKAEQVRRVAEQQGVRLDEIGGMDVYCLAINMMYSDYCAVARRYGVDKIEFYADLAKAFLKDKDFDGTPEEKLYLYYKCIVDDE